jgi:hypothetical protein
MTDKTRALILALLALAAAAIGLLIGYFQPETVTPIPSPSPSVVASPSPSPSPASAGAIPALPGETITLELPPQAPIALGASSSVPADFAFFEMREVETLQPSFIGAAVGKYRDALVPTTTTGAYPVWVDVAVRATATPGVYPFTLAGKLYSIQVRSTPIKRQFPFYMELTSRDVWRAFNLPDHVSHEARVTKKFIDLYRAHLLEPIKQDLVAWPTVKADGTLDYDRWQEYGASLRQLVLTGNLYPPLILRWNPTTRPGDALLKAIQAGLASGTLPPGSWYYLWDEQELQAGVKAEGQARAQSARTLAPSLKIMATWRQDAALLPLVDYFSPVVDWYDPSNLTRKPYWLYTSCMAQGSCANGSPANPSGTPMMVLDAPAIHAQAFPVVAYALGASTGFYYKGTKKVPSAWTTGGQYDEGGNGDGTLVYPGANETAVASVRMKRLRQGLQLVNVLMQVPDQAWVKAELAKLVQGAKSWSKDPAAYEALRIAAEGKL